MGATDAEEASEEAACPLRVALKARPHTVPETGAWVKGWGPFTLRNFVDVIERVAETARQGVGWREGVQQHRVAFVDEHPGVRAFLEHALERYFEYHEAREEQLGELHFIAIKPVIRKAPKAELFAWGALYESATGNREFRRFRFGSARDTVTAWSHIAAHVAAEARGQFDPHRIWVTEIGLLDGIENHILDGLTPEAIRALYEQHGRVAANLATQGTEARPGSGCSDCKYTGGCGALIPMSGFLEAERPSPWTQSVSASDLELYERCHSRWFMQRRAKLPRETEDSEALLRGVSVHEWIANAHQRGKACSSADLPSPDSAVSYLGSGLLDPGDYTLAYPYLRSHVSCCPFNSHRVETLASEHTMYGFDTHANTVVVTKGDMLWHEDDALIMREVKTTQNLLDPTETTIFDRYLAVAWALVALDAGLVQWYGATRGQVQLELLTPQEARVFVYHTDDVPLMRMARGRIRRLAADWLYDETWEPSPSGQCATCVVRRWCPARDEWSRTGVSEASGAAPTTGDDLPPF